MKRTFQTPWFIALSLTISMGLIEGCSKKSKFTPGNPNAAQVADSDSTEPGESDGLIDPQAPEAVGLRTFDSLNKTYSVLTGVPTARVFDAYMNLKSGLAASSSVKGISPSIVSSMTKLAAQYCDVLTVSDPNNNAAEDIARRDAFFGSSFTQWDANPDNAFNDTSALAGVLVDKLWGTGLDSLPDRAGTVTSINELITVIKAGKNAAQTPAIVMGACTSVLTSTPVTFY